MSIWTLTLLLGVSAIWVALFSAVAYLASATAGGHRGAVAQRVFEKR